jgi:hypothetical protein
MSYEDVQSKLKLAEELRATQKISELEKKARDRVNARKLIVQAAKVEHKRLALLIAAIFGALIVFLVLFGFAWIWPSVGEFIYSI